MIELKKPDLLQSANYINGSWERGTETYDVRNPADGATIATVSCASQALTEKAITAAHRALSSWRKMRAADRSERLTRWAQLLCEHQDDLARIMTAEQGKPLAEAAGEVTYAAGFLSWFAEEAKRAYGDIIPSHLAGARILATREPVGVVGAITPWNFPLAMITRKAGAALAAGCTMVVKPSEETPLSAFALCALAAEAGIPAGVMNAVSGDADIIGRTLCDSPQVRKLSFTGSGDVGKLIMGQAAPTLKKLSLELGGNAPFIVFDDADLDAAVAGAMASKFRNTGQTCVCVNRFLIHAPIFNTFVAKLRDAVLELKVGDGTETAVTQGPLINETALKKVTQHVKDATNQGAQLICGGKTHRRGGTFFEPTILTEVTPTMLCAQEETFGPVAACMRFGTEDEALTIANATSTGLAAYCYTQDIGRAWRVAEALEVGMVGINEGIISTPVAPFGGIKESGLGREGSKYGIDEYLEIKYILMGGI